MFNRKATLALLALAGVVGAVELARRPAVQRALRKTIHKAIVAADLAAINERLGIYRDTASSSIRPTAENLWGYNPDENLFDEEEDEEEAENEKQERRANKEAFDRYLADMNRQANTQPEAFRSEIDEAARQLAQKSGRHRTAKSNAQLATPEPPAKVVRKPRAHRVPPSAGIVVGIPDPGPTPARKPRVRKIAPKAESKP